jgi:hypothetical protein
VRLQGLDFQARLALIPFTPILELLMHAHQAHIDAVQFGVVFASLELVVAADRLLGCPSDGVQLSSNKMPPYRHIVAVKRIARLRCMLGCAVRDEPCLSTASDSYVRVRRKAEPGSVS